MNTRECKLHDNTDARHNPANKEAAHLVQLHDTVMTLWGIAQAPDRAQRKQLLLAAKEALDKQCQTFEDVLREE